MTAEQLRIFRIVKIILFNTFPIAGHFLFGWGFFEVALTYIVETFAVFMVFFIYTYAIAKKTRYPFVFAIFQVGMVMIPLSFFIFMYIIIAFYILEPNLASKEHMFDILGRRLVDFQIYVVALIFIFLEGISFALRLKKTPKIKTLWFNIRKFLFVHFFIFACLLLFPILASSIILQIVFLMIFKMVLDYVVDEEQFFEKAKRKLNESKIMKRFWNEG